MVIKTYMVTGSEVKKNILKRNERKEVREGKVRFKNKVWNWSAQIS